MKKRRIIYYILACVVLTQIDQITKVITEAKLNYEGLSIIPGVFKLYCIRNQGAAWGVLSGKISLFVVITCLIIAIVTYVIIRLPEDKKYNLLFWTLTVLVSGAIGNFIDRIRFGYVRDFLYFELIDFPVFNVADIFVTCSVIVLIILIFFVYKDEDFDFLNLKKKN